MIITSSGTMAFAEVEINSDITGHWAEETIQQWIDAGVIGGYTDGTFKPDQSITRAEFVEWVNNLFNFQVGETASFSDVPAGAWYADDVNIAVYEGFISGYEDGTFRPEEGISRQEVAKVISFILDMDGTDLTALNVFKDKAEVPDWSRKSLIYMVGKGYFSGYPDKTLKPTAGITRAETIALLGRVAGTVYKEAGIFGPEVGIETIDGNVTVTADGVTIQNVTINGDLHVSAGVGEGEATFENVTVKGATIINGGGISTVRFNDSSLTVLEVSKKHSKVRVLIMGTTHIDDTHIKDGSILDEEDLTGSGYGDVEIIRVQPGETVVLRGEYGEIIIDGGFDLVLAAGCKIDKLTIGAGAEGTHVTGSGTIGQVTINAEGVEIEQKVDDIILGTGIKSASVHGKEITEVKETIIYPSGGGHASPTATVKSTNAGLSDLTLNGKLVTGFDTTTMTYNVELANGTIEVPTVVAIVTDTGKANAVVTAAGSLPGATTIDVTAEDGKTTKTYTINFTIAELIAEEEQILRLNWSSNPPDLDPQTTTDTVSFQILNATLEGMVRLNAQGEAVIGSGLAEDVQISDNGSLYTFTLRDAKWSDGTQITAYDFEYAWLRAIDPATASEYAYQLYHIENAQAANNGEIGMEEVGIKALDDMTLEVQLERVTPFFLSLTSFITYLPAQKAAVEQMGDTYASSPETMVYSGPFVVSEWIPDQKLNLVKNENYWDKDSVKLEEIQGNMVADLNTPINQYEAGELDIISVPTEYLDMYRESAEFTSMAEAVVWYLQYNTADEFFTNLKIRKAFSIAINRQAFVDNVLANGSQVAWALTPPGIPGIDGGDFNEQCAGEVYDAGTMGQVAIDEANALLDEGLAEVGKTREELGAHISYLTGESDVSDTLGQALQKMWKDSFDIDVPIEAVSFQIRLEKYNEGQFTISLAGWGGDFDDPMTFMNMLVTGGGNNDTFWGSPVYDANIEASINGTGNERIQSMINAQQVLWHEWPISPVYYPARNFVEKPYVKGIVRFPVGVDNEYKWAYIDSDAVAVDSITLTPETLNLTAGGETGIVIGMILPANASNQSMTWSTSDAGTATVVAGVVTPVAAGTATITATTVDGSKTDTTVVTVVEPLNSMEIFVVDSDATYAPLYDVLPGVFPGAPSNIESDPWLAIHVERDESMLDTKVQIANITITKDGVEVGKGVTGPRLNSLEFGSFLTAYLGAAPVATGGDDDSDDALGCDTKSGNYQVTIVYGGATYTKTLEYTMAGEITENTLVAELASAKDFVYVPAYTFVGEESFDSDTNTFAAVYASEEFATGEAMNDMARYLGALHRQENATISSLVYKDVLYVWDDEGGLKGSNWVDQVGTTLVSAIVADSVNYNPATGVVIIVRDGVNEETLTLKFSVVDGPLVFGIKSVEKNMDVTQYVPNDEATTVSYEGNTVTVGGTIPYQAESILGSEPGGNLFELKITMENEDKSTAALKSEGSVISTYSADGHVMVYATDGTLIREYDLGTGWMDGDNYVYYLGAAQKGGIDVITIDNDGNWSTTNDAKRLEIIIAEDAVLQTSDEAVVVGGINTTLPTTDGSGLEATNIGKYTVGMATGTAPNFATVIAGTEVLVDVVSANQAQGTAKWVGVLITTDQDVTDLAVKTSGEFINLTQVDSDEAVAGGATGTKTFVWWLKSELIAPTGNDISIKLQGEEDITAVKLKVIFEPYLAPAPDTRIIKDTELNNGVASFTWSSVNGIGSENGEISGSYTYYTDGAYLRFQVKDANCAVVKFADVFQTSDDGNNANGGMTLQTNSGTINDMDGSNREKADWGVDGFDTYATNLPNDGTDYVFYGLIQNTTVGTKTVGFEVAESRNIDMTLTPIDDLAVGTYTVIVEAMQQGNDEVKGTITYTIEVQAPASAPETALTPKEVADVGNSTDLDAAIVLAQDLHDNAVEGAEVGNYAVDSKATLLTAIEAAQAVVDKADPAATIAEVATAEATLAEAVAAFEEGQVVDVGGTVE